MLLEHSSNEGDPTWDVLVHGPLLLVWEGLLTFSFSDLFWEPLVAPSRELVMRERVVQLAPAFGWKMTAISSKTIKTTS